MARYRSGTEPASSTTRLDPDTRRLVAVFLAGAVLPLLDTTIVNVALDRLAAVFHAPVSTIQWVVTGYAMATALAIPVSAWAVRRFGGRRMWLFSLATFLAGSVLCGLAPNVGILVASRVVQGIGGGMSMPVLQTLLVRSAGQRQARRAMAAIGFPTVIAPVVGPVIGGVIVDGASWRWVFLVNVPVCLVALVWAWRGVPPTESDGSARLDGPGLALLAPGLVALVYALSRATGPEELAGWPFLLSFAVSLVLLAVFGRYALRTVREPVMDLRLFTVPSFTGAALTLWLSGIVFYGSLVLLPLYYQQVPGYSVLGAGLVLASQGVGALLARSLSGRGTDRVGTRAIVLAGLVAAVMGTLPFAVLDGGLRAWLLAGLVVRGAGLGIVTVSVMGAAYHDVPRESVAHASAVSRILLQLGAALGAAAVTTVLAWQVDAGTAADLEHAYQVTFRWLLVATAVTAVPALALPGRHPGGR
ncbi:EmrB/QacA subfamily drug resistance transporter [Haloactinospora alba]|uniref:EmrB/QacA subfamily drug resistance transporter n=1 Tax=Haloactinospora alba TaxID=405555 RepID=A0A543N9I0_9ACTN|nr:MDR family MFS transporter [Haloactinospora alba]TQN28493.1 EmrB/QacA subfamily drug resistance transporter [Haloactinospora alba]